MGLQGLRGIAGSRCALESFPNLSARGFAVKLSMLRGSSFRVTPLPSDDGNQRDFEELSEQRHRHTDAFEAGIVIMEGRDVPRRISSESGVIAKFDIDDIESQRLKEENYKLWDIVDGHYVRSNVQPAGILDRRMAYICGAVERANLSSVLFTSRPMAAALTKRPFQIAVFLVSLFFFLEFVAEVCLLYTTEWGFRSQMVRFVPSQLRNGERENIRSPHISSFGLLHDKCTVSGIGNSSVVGNTFVLNFPEPVHANGFFVQTALSDPEKDPTHFFLEASEDDGATWRRVAAGRSRFGFGGRIELLDTSAPIPVERGESIFFSMTPTWEVHVHGPLRNFLNTFFFFLTAELARMGLARVAKWAFIADFVCLFALCVAVATGHVLREQYTLSAVWWAEALGNLIIPCMVLWREELLVRALFAHGIYYVVVMSVVIKEVAKLGYSDLIHTLVAGSVMASIALLFKYFRGYVLCRSRATILPDKEAYDAQWQQLVDKDLSGALLRLAAAFDHIQAHQQGGPARHFQRLPVTNRRSSCSGCYEDFGMGVAGTRDFSHPVHSLDQLYSQAVAMDLVLKQKVQQWADRGLFPVLPACSDAPSRTPSSPAFFLKWAEAKHDDELRRSVKWGRIKSVERAIEKAVRTYSSDVSFLVDIVRQCIVFESVDDLTQALCGICNDADVRVDRVKNRLDHRYDAWNSAGYRDVSINLRVVSSETKRLGIENHVVELQLLLVQFATLKQDAGHARYVAWRNERGQ